MLCGVFGSFLVFIVFLVVFSGSLWRLVVFWGVVYALRCFVLFCDDLFVFSDVLSFFVVAWVVVEWPSGFCGV